MSMFDKAFKVFGRTIVKHSVEIAMGGAVLGLGLTIWTSSKAAIKVEKIYIEDIPKTEKIKKSVKPCLPVAASVIFTLASIAGMYAFGRKKQAALLSLLVSTQGVFQHYRNNERKKIGTKEEAERYADAVESSKGSKTIPDIAKKDDEIVICDSVTGQTKAMKEADVYKAFYLANREFILRGELEFNNLLEYLNLEKDDILYGFGWEQTMGWEYYGYQFIDFRVVPRTDKNGKKYMLITYPFLPHALYPDEMGRDIDDCIMLNPSIDTDLWKKMSPEERADVLQTQVVSVARE